MKTYTDFTERNRMSRIDSRVPRCPNESVNPCNVLSAGAFVQVIELAA